MWIKTKFITDKNTAHRRRDEKKLAASLLVAYLLLVLQIPCIYLSIPSFAARGVLFEFNYYVDKHTSMDFLSLFGI